MKPILLLVAVTVLLGVTPPSAVHFTDITTQAGIHFTEDDTGEIGVVGNPPKLHREAQAKIP